MTQEDRPTRQSGSHTRRWVAVAASAVAVVFSLVDGQLLLASMWAALGLGILVEATRLDERSAAAKRLGQVLTVLFVALCVFYLYSIVVS